MPPSRSGLVRLIVAHPIIFEPIELTEGLLLRSMTTLHKRFPVRFQPPYRTPLALWYPGSGVNAVHVFIIDPLLLDRPAFDFRDRVENFDRLGREFGHGVVVRLDEESVGGDGFDEFLVTL